MKEIKFDTHTSTVYFPYGKLNCRLYIFNFLYRNYNLENVQICIKYFELNGEFIESKIISFRDDESIILDSKKMKFKRDIIVELSLVNKYEIKGIIRAFADYYNNKTITCVHEQGAFWTYSKDIVSQGNINLICQKDVDMYALIQNTHITQKDISFNIRVYNYRGDSILLKGKKLKFREFCKFRVTNKQVCKFLNGKNGHFTIEYDSYIGRAAYIYISKDYNYTSVSHATYYAFDKREHTQKDYYKDKHHTIQSFILLSDYNQLSSKVILFNDYKEKEYFDVELYDHNGNFIKKYEKIITLKHNQSKEITPNLLGVKKFIGSIKIIAYFKHSNPLYVNSNYIIYTEKNMADSAIEFIPKLNHVDKKFIENYVNEKAIRSATLHRSRQFYRGVINEIYDSYLLITFTSIIKNKSTNIKISFISKNGKISITKYIHLKLNQFLFKNIKDMLSKKELSLLGEYFSIYLRDPNNKVSSLILLKNKKTGDIGMDHFVGA